MEKLRFYRQAGRLDPTLNAMSRKGFTVKRTAFGFYLFSSCPPGEYTHQTVWIFGMKREERQQMIDRLSRSGIVPVSQRLFWICFRGKGFFNPYQNRMQKAEALGWQRSILFLRSFFCRKRRRALRTPTQKENVKATVSRVYQNSFWSKSPGIVYLPFKKPLKWGKF